MSTATAEDPVVQAMQRPLSGRQDMALFHLLTADSIADAAKASGIAETTLHRWLKHDPHFRQTYEECKRLYRQRVVEDLAEMTAKEMAPLQRLANEAFPGERAA